ncbi:MAG: tetratricopeptide repeat protein [Candidatus Omnitrophica bacterium]|nr:tetratricopeptide repeat protein [Candidatus Omnitrophota bacterium]
MHTVNAETVNYISARSDLLSTLFVVLALCTYMYGPSLRRFSIYLIPLFLAFLVKLTVVVFPLLLFFYIVLIEQGLSLPQMFARKNLSVLGRATLETVPSWMVSGLMLALSAHMTPKTFLPSYIKPWNYILTQPMALFHYFSSFFFPSRLCADIEFQPMSGILDKRVIIGCVFILATIILMVRFSRVVKQRPMALGILWFFIASIPTSCGVVPLAESMNDHRMFFPFLGLMMAVGWGVKLGLDHYQDKIRRHPFLKGILVVALLLVYVGHMYGTYQRNKVWKNEESLWYDVTIKSPQNGRGLMNYGLTQMAKGNYKRALNYFERSLVYNPRYSTLYINLAIVKDAFGDTNSAEQFFLVAMFLEKTNPNSYYYYARYLSHHNRFDEALPLLRTCLDLSPGYADCSDLLLKVQEQRPPLSTFFLREATI